MASGIHLKDHQAHVPLQAVVIADSFNERFMPLTHERPRCLLPLANTPLLDYTLEFLATSEMEDIFIVCAGQAEMIKDHITKSKRWSSHVVRDTASGRLHHPQQVAQPLSQQAGQSGVPQLLTHAPLKLHLFEVRDARSVGDVMRVLDAKHVIQGDFILVQGDVISSINFKPFMEAFKLRREGDRDILMSMMAKKSAPRHRSKSNADNAVFVIDTNTNCLLDYRMVVAATSSTLGDSFDILTRAQRNNSHIRPTKSFEIDTGLFQKAKELVSLQVRHDLIDCQIDICSMEVPPLFTENFDYQDMRKDFVKGILESDVLGKKILCQILDDNQYANRVRTTRTYDAISKDVISRWSFPLVPDHNILPDQCYMHFKNHIYKEPNLSIAHSARILSHTVIGQNSSIGEQTIISHSVIGRHVKIGKNCTIRNAYIFDHADIQDGACITKAVLGEAVTIGSKATISRGALLGPRVVVGQGITIGPFVKVGDRVQPGSESDIDTSREVTENFIGEDGLGYRWWDRLPEDEWDEEAEVGGQLVWQLGCQEEDMIRNDVYDDVTSESDDSDSETSLEIPRVLSQASSSLQQPTMAPGIVTNAEASRKEVRETLRRGFEDEKCNINVVGLEITGVKYATNITYHDVLDVIVEDILVHSRRQMQEGSKVADLLRIITPWTELWKKFAPETGDMQHLLYRLTVAIPSDDAFLMASVPQLLMSLYQKDVIDEEAFSAWYETRHHLQKHQSVFAKAMKFIEWLEESDDDEEEDEEEESEDNDASEDSEESETNPTSSDNEGDSLRATEHPSTALSSDDSSTS